MTFTTTSPACTAILVNYNQGALIKGALDAAIKQTVPFDEILIIDDGSTDNSVEIIRQCIAQVPHARLIQNPHNMGVVATANRGVTEATSDFVYFMSADDDYSTHILEWCKPMIAAHPSIGMVCGNISVYNVDTAHERQFTLPFPPVAACYDGAAITAIAQRRAFSFFGCNLIRREAILQQGYQRPELKWAADWLLYLLIGYSHPFAVVPQYFVRIRQSGEQYSHERCIWKTQRPVVVAYIRALRTCYADHYALFRRNAVIPSYEPQALFMFLTERDMQHYLTPLLFWRLATYQLLRAVGRLLPDKARGRIRQFFRV